MRQPDPLLGRLPAALRQAFKQLGNLRAALQEIFQALGNRPAGLQETFQPLGRLPAALRLIFQPVSHFPVTRSADFHLRISFLPQDFRYFFPPIALDDDFALLGRAAYAALYLEHLA